MTAKTAVGRWRGLLEYIEALEPPDQVAVLTEVVNTAKPVIVEHHKQGFAAPEWITGKPEAEQKKLPLSEDARIAEALKRLQCPLGAEHRERVAIATIMDAIEILQKT